MVNCCKELLLEHENGHAWAIRRTRMRCYTHVWWSGSFQVKDMKKILQISLLSTLVLLMTLSAFAQQLYISNESKMSLELLDFGVTPPALTTLFTAPAKLDDLTLNAQGQLIYSIPSLGQVDLYDPVAQQNSVLVTGVKLARDLEIEPGGQSMLIAIYSPGGIVRFNFATGTITTLAKKLGTCDGIAYDPYGNLYAVANHNTIVQIDPVAGTILNTLVLEPHHGINGADGLTYDSYSGNLWATHDGTTGPGVLQIPITATGLSGTYTFYLFTLLSRKGVAPDGIKSDGLGNLYIGGIWNVVVFNIPTSAITQTVVVSGADGVSLVPGTYPKSH